MEVIMEDSNSNDSNSQSWRATANRCREALKREDLRQVDELIISEETASGVNTPGRRSFATIIEELKSLSEQISHLEDFFTAFDTRVGPRNDNAIFWGMLLLSMKFSTCSRPMNERLLVVVKGIGHQAELFHEDKNGCNDREILIRAAGNMTTELLEFLIQRMQFYRACHGVSYAEQTLHALSYDYGTAQTEMGKVFRKLSELAQAKDEEARQLAIANRYGRTESD